MNSLIRVENIEKHYGQFKALNGVSWEFEKETEYIIKGGSGSGKSTLLYLLGGLDSPTKGKVEFLGKNLSNLHDDDLSKYRNSEVGFVFQFHFLLPSMKCLDNILLPGRLGKKNISEVKSRAMELAKTLKVEHCLAKFPYELSGGEQQRINIIRALSLGPKLLLCDEPTGNLDSKNSKVVIDLIRELSLEFKSTLIIVTHDEKIASLGERVIHIEDGVIVQ